MKTVALLFLGLVVLATTSIYFTQKSGDLFEFADEQSCIRFFEFGYTYDNEFSGVQNICKQKNVAFTVKFIANHEEQTKTTLCLAYRETGFVAVIDDSFEIINYTAKEC